MSGKADLRALTSVRGIAAWFVVGYHIRLSAAGLPADVVHILAKGYLAVDFFFLLSGFVIWMSYADRLRTGGMPAIGDFLKRRIARIWPLHMVMLAGAVALALLLAATGRHDGRDFPFAELPLHVLLVQNWGFTHDLTWNDPAWSISAELGAYLLFPLLALTMDWRRVPSWAVLAAIVALVVLLDAAMAAGGATTLGHDIARFGLLRCITEFAAGTAICALWLRWHAAWQLPAIIAAALAALLIAASATGLLPELLAVPLGFAALLLALALSAGRRGNVLEAGWLVYLGEVSYATYLGHFLLFMLFKLALVDDPHAIPPLLIGLYLAMVLASSIALHHLVERPAQRLINGLRRPPPFFLHDSPIA